MVASFLIAAAVAVLASILAITRANAVHALVYFVVSLFSTALMFFLLGAPFAAALEVIIYAGAIMVLFIFVVMLLDLSPKSVAAERRLTPARIWWGPIALVLVLGVQLIAAVASARGPDTLGEVPPKAVGVTLMSTYVLGVEIASMLLLAGLVGAYHIGRRHDSKEDRG